MSRANYLFTSESVSEGHPDKVCDRISDAVVDLYLAADPLSRVAIETLVTTNRIVMAGEVRGPESVTPELIEQAARRAVREIGYEQKGFHWEHAEFQNYVHEQSADIARGVDADADEREGRRRGRPGHHVRLRLPRDRAADAGADLLCASHPARDGEGAAYRAHARAWARRQEPGDARLRGRQAGARGFDRGLHPARRGCEPGAGQGDRARLRRRGDAERLGQRLRPNSMSTRPGAS